MKTLGKENIDPASCGFSAVRSSPRRRSLFSPKNADVLMPAAESSKRLSLSADSPVKNKSPANSSSLAVRSSPRNINNNSVQSPVKTPTKSNAASSLSPRKLALMNSTPTKGDVAARSSPRRSAQFSPSRIAERNMVIAMVHESPKQKTPLKQLNSPKSPTLKSVRSSPRLAKSSPYKVMSSPYRLMLSDSPVKLSGSPNFQNSTCASDERSPLKSSRHTSQKITSPAKATQEARSSVRTRGTPLKIVEHVKSPTRTRRTPVKMSSLSSPLSKNRNSNVSNSCDTEITNSEKENSFEEVDQILVSKA